MRVGRPEPGKRSRQSAAEATPYRRDRNIGFLLRKAYQKNIMLFQKHCIDAQLTSVQLAAMHALAENGPCSLTELGRLAAMDPATTGGVVDRLKDRGLVRPAQDPSDRRKVIVELEPPGRRLVEDMIPVVQAVADLTLLPLDAAERATLIELLFKVTAAEEEAKPPAGA